MQTKIAVGLVGLWLGWSSVSADVSEMIFYPQADFSEGIFHFNYQGEKNKNYGFMFEKGFDPARIVYVRPSNHRMEKTKEGMTKLSFENTDRYSYLERANKDDFLVSEENGIIKILLSGGDCKGSAECVTAENILTVNVPKGYGVRKYQGLDQDLKPLKNPQWQRNGNTYTLTARDVKGACVMMELGKLKAGQSAASVAIAEPKAVAPVRVAEVIKPVVEEAKVVAVAEVVVEEVKAPTPVVVATAEPKVQESTPSVEPKVVVSVLEKPIVKSATPAPYFRNFQIFESRVVALSEVGKGHLREWAQLFKAGGYTSVTINGYTDNIPPQRLKALYATNEILSEARAKMVADYLITQGIDAKAIKVVGMGDANPTASNDNEEGRSKNRRVEFILSR
ncbi:MAG: OmpA family protein [Sulfuricurvum sp.]|uniref:OmpA family protein n=1 Tax=Sulfuricurvum sp. TaxID=2025608 RepID=UPI0025EF7A7E|nr:OmpA family protein [Sulfuricurvum sp.]MBV5322125.1 OmpA family protein [Sulfuricurvum sp.]